jgi:hypothetical protein
VEWVGINIWGCGERSGGWWWWGGRGVAAANVVAAQAVLTIGGVASSGLTDDMSLSDGEGRRSRSRERNGDLHAQVESFEDEMRRMFKSVMCHTRDIKKSIAELEELSGVKNITDIHKDKVDGIEIPSKRGKVCAVGVGVGDP